MSTETIVHSSFKYTDVSSDHVQTVSLEELLTQTEWSQEEIDQIEDLKIGAVMYVDGGNLRVERIK